MIRVTVWNEFVHEKTNAKCKELYPEGIHGAIKDFLSEEEDFCVRTATLDDEECGLTDEVLKNTDVLIWWGHAAHSKVPDEIAIRIRDAVHNGMGFIALHSAHASKPFKLLMGTAGNLSWRESGDFERLWTITHAHPITADVPDYIELEHEETYAEPFGIPEPDELLFIGWFSSGEVFRSGCTFKRNNGRIFYFQPGHETFPTFYNEHIQKVIKNGVRYVNPVYRSEKIEFPNIPKTNK
ncbi:MAG: ThuA domain-containing protein [Acutalibacteraceae bacterium]|nr:ThuA domain-containing protein [Acutalibacteraceae bacterium]